MTYEIGFTGEEATFEPIPKGNYKAFVNSIVEKEGPNGPYLNVRLVIAEGGFKGRSLFTNCSLTNEAKWKLQNLLIATGLAEPRKKATVRFENNDLIGKEVWVKVAEGEYNGEVRPEVRNFFREGATTGQDAQTTPQKTETSSGVKRL